MKEFIRDGSNEIHSVRALNHILFDLLGDYMNELYSDATDHQKHKFESSNIDLHSDSVSSLDLNDYIMRDLFLWAILVNQIEIAKVFLSFMKYRICPALIATKILRKYSQKAIYGELKSGYIENADYFEQYAVHCLDRCDDHYSAEAGEIILQSLELYGYVSCVQVIVLDY